MTHSILSLIHELNPNQKALIHKFVNILMTQGKKTKSRQILFQTIEVLRESLPPSDEKDKHKPTQITIDYLFQAISNVQPLLEVKKIRIAGSTQWIPSTISVNRQQTLAIRWILEAAKKRPSVRVSFPDRSKGTRFSHKLAAEILEASKKTGFARKKRDELHKLAEANRSFSHYRWWSL
uniref:Ribosomal protein S7 n=1 Tax=Chaetosphaeridium globosum TaxID=96477 RepID=Q8M1E8_CHAGL|nr:ribosomal protein S7 [Chaetosphaeridium globosum]AAM96627.1 ribosomal protein S7 [Chaetosphaeridium globosum]